VLPINELCQVKTIKFHNDAVEYATSGSNVDIGLLNIEVNMLQVGSVLCDPLDPIPMVTSFKAQIVTFNPQPPLLRGSQVRLGLCVVKPLVRSAHAKH
jgi:translation elongation factor EF-1alpha